MGFIRENSIKIKIKIKTNMLRSTPEYILESDKFATAQLPPEVQIGTRQVRSDACFERNEKPDLSIRGANESNSRLFDGTRCLSPFSTQFNRIMLTKFLFRAFFLAAVCSLATSRPIRHRQNADNTDIFDEEKDEGMIGQSGAAQGSMDDQLVQIARAASNIGLDWTLDGKTDIFEAERTEENRDNLKRATTIALASARTEQFVDLMDEESDNFSPALKNWNSRGSDPSPSGETEREIICGTLRDTAGSKVPQDVKDCMCNGTEPFIRCEMMLGSAALGYHARRMRERKLVATGEILPDGDQQERRRSQATCNIESTPPDLLGGPGSKPSFADLVQKTSGEVVKGVGVTGSCCFDLQPPPLNIVEACGEVEISIPDEEWMTPEGAVGAIADGSIFKGSEDIKEQASSIKGSVNGKLCWAISSELEQANLKIVEDILEFLGIELCFVTLGVEFWPIRGHTQFQVELKGFIFFASAGLRWQASTELRDTLGLCENVEPVCEERDSLFCTMDAGDVMGYIEVGLDFFLFDVSLSKTFPENAVEECDQYEDGTRCLLGTSCNKCRNPVTYWYAKAFTACGSEPKYSDGTICLLGTSCNQCENEHSFWPTKFTWACGDMPCFDDGTVCLQGTTCKECCSGESSFWASKFTFACGDMPCWDDGTICLAGTTCKECCSGKYSFWASKFTWACGDAPCWSAGTTCLACGNCCNGSWWFTCT